MVEDDMAAAALAVLSTLLAILGLFLWARSVDLGMSVFGFGLLVFGVAFDFWLLKRHFDIAETRGRVIVSGIGNKWKAEVLWQVEFSPWRPLAGAGDAELRAALAAAARLMSGSLEGRRHANRVYRLVGRPCPRCGERILSRGQGDANRTAYWCPGCQRCRPALPRRPRRCG